MMLIMDSTTQRDTPMSMMITPILYTHGKPYEEGMRKTDVGKSKKNIFALI